MTIKGSSLTIASVEQVPLSTIDKKCARCVVVVVVVLSQFSCMNHYSSSRARKDRRIEAPLTDRKRFRQSFSTVSWRPSIPLLVSRGSAGFFFLSSDPQEGW